MNMHIYSAKQGEELVKAARNSIELFLTNPYFNKKVVQESLERFTEKHGIFVTIEHYPTKELRGCIGFPKAIAPIKESVVDAAIAAAFEDPRFVPVSKRELEDLTIEISVLSVPEPVKGDRSARLNAVKVGRDGLIVEYGMYSGLLLPIVAVEQHWDEQEFLGQACIKAGLSPNYWHQPNVSVYRFQSQVFREESPSGKVSEVMLE
jgi:hypothetical protein